MGWELVKGHWISFKIWLNKRTTECLQGRELQPYCHYQQTLLMAESRVTPSCITPLSCSTSASLGQSALWWGRREVGQRTFRWVLVPLCHAMVPPRLLSCQGCGSDCITLQLSPQACMTPFCFSLDGLALLTLPINVSSVVLPRGNSSTSWHGSVRYRQHAHPLPDSHH